MHPDRIASIMSGNPNFSPGSSHFTTASCIVFVGNIPYGLAENQLTDIFNSVGRVVCFRMVFDRETGRSKGYGFAEYIDAETAASAVRNLDGYEIMGRKLRVDYSSQGYVGKEGYPGRNINALDCSTSSSKDSLSVATAKDEFAVYDNIYVRSAYNSENGYTETSCDTPTTGRFPIPSFTGESRGAPPTTSPSALEQPAGLSSFLASLPPGTDPHPNLTITDSISKTLAAVPPLQMLMALSQMKELISTDPVKATETLRHCPQLAHALFQAMVMMNLVKPEVVSQLLEGGMVSNGPQSLQPHNDQMTGFQQSLSQQQQQYIQQHIQQQMGQGGPQQQQPGFYGYPFGQFGGFVGGEFLRQQMQMQQQQIQIAQQLQAAQAMQGMKSHDGTDDKALLLQRVKLLTPEEISRLPSDQAQQILMLKHKLMGDTGYQI